MTPYKLQLVQQLKDTDKPAHCDFRIATQERLEDDGSDLMTGLFLAMGRPST